MRKQPQHLHTETQSGVCLVSSNQSSHCTAEGWLAGDELSILQGETPQATVPDAPHCLGLPEKFPIPKRRASLHLITAPDLLHDDMTISLSFRHIQRATGCLSIFYRKGSPSPHQSPEDEFPAPAVRPVRHLQDVLGLHFPWVLLLKDLCSSPGAAALGGPIGAATASPLKLSRAQF